MEFTSCKIVLSLSGLVELGGMDKIGNIGKSLVIMFIQNDLHFNQWFIKHFIVKYVL